MCKRTMYKRARIPMFLWERRACANSGSQAVFPRPRKNGLGTRLAKAVPFPPRPTHPLRRRIGGKGLGRYRPGRLKYLMTSLLQ